MGRAKLTKDEFSKRGGLKYNNKYDYSLFVYVNNKTKGKIICPKHGIFEQRPCAHLSVGGCKQCGIDKRSKNRSLGYDNFVEQANKKHEYKYSYSLVAYKNTHSKVKIICPEHSIFEQTPHNHLQGKGCPKCGGSYPVTKEDFVFRGNKKHNNKYSYKLVEYLNMDTKVKIICPEHDIFEQTPSNHLSGQGCPYCKSSKGEDKIISYLIENNIKYIRQYIFNDCRSIRPLKFDFYLPNYNVCIEFDGEGHFKKFYFEHDNIGLYNRLKRDTIKTKYCLNNKIPLIRISYKDDLIPVLIKKLAKLLII